MNHSDFQLGWFSTLFHKRVNKHFLSFISFQIQRHYNLQRPHHWDFRCWTFLRLNRWIRSIFFIHFSPGWVSSNDRCLQILCEWQRPSVCIDNKNHLPLISPSIRLDFRCFSNGGKNTPWDSNLEEIHNNHWVCFLYLLWSWIRTSLMIWSDCWATFSGKLFSLRWLSFCISHRNKHSIHPKYRPLSLSPDFH